MLAVAVCTFVAVQGLSAVQPQRHAVVIGISDYADQAIPDLKYAESDARAVYDTLTDPKVGRFPKSNVSLLLGKAATPQAIRAALGKFRTTRPDDLVVIFYAGHAAGQGDEALWVAQNASLKALAATSVTNSDIRKHLAQIPSQRVVVLLDCCYATSAVKASRVDPKRLFGDFRGKGRAAIAGSTDSPEAAERQGAKAGVFAHFLVQGLRGKADTNADGTVTFDEIWLYLGSNIREASVKRRGLHEPVIIAEGGVAPQFLLTFSPAARNASKQAVDALQKLASAGEITPAQFKEGRNALTDPAIDAVAGARREVYADLAAGKLSAKYLADVLAKRVREARGATPAVRLDKKQTLAIVPFDVLGEVKVKDAGRILAEHLLPVFADRFELIDQTQLKRFLQQDELTVAGLSELVRSSRTKALAKAVKMRGVRYLVVGTVSGLPDGSLSVTARITEWQTGSMGRVAQIRGSNWNELLRRGPMLAFALGAGGGGVDAQASEADKEYRRLLDDARGILNRLKKDIEAMDR